MVKVIDNLRKHKELLMYGSILLILSILYCFFHAFSWGSIDKAAFQQLTPTEVADIQNILKGIDDELEGANKGVDKSKVDLVKRHHIASYIQSRYELYHDSLQKLDKNEPSFQLYTGPNNVKIWDTTNLAKTETAKSIDSLFAFEYKANYPNTKFAQMLYGFSKSQYAPSYLNNVTFKVKSFFWLASGGVYWEVIFWSLIGVLCSHLYHISERKRKGEYKEEERSVHIAKLFYTPVISVIIYFNLDLLIGDGKIDLMGMTYGVIVLAFLLGFFSGRSIELLNRIKNLLFPEEKSNDNTSSKKEEGAFKNLSSEKQFEIMKAAIDEKGEAWIGEFKYYDGGVAIAKRIKTVEGKEKVEDENCLVFQVSNKQSGIDPEWKIPDYIEYRGFKIPTDVIEVGETKPCNSIVAQPGSSIYRESGYFGTLGLRVSKTINHITTDYILSCFHVLFPIELKKGDLSITSPNDCIGSTDVFESNGHIKIATATKGFLTKEIDAGVAEISKDSKIGKQLIGKIKINGVYPLNKNDGEFELDVKVYGHSSKYRKEVIKSSYCSQTVNYNKNRSLWMRGLIQISNKAQEGDSGGIITTWDRKVVGMVIGTDDKFTYALPIKRILAYFNLDIDED